MRKRPGSIIVSLALLVGSPLAIQADEITFNFVSHPTNESVTLTNTLGHTGSIATVNGSLSSVTDSVLGETFVVPGTITISSIHQGAGSVWDPTSSTLLATYTVGAAIEVLSSKCTGGTEPGVCLAGIDNTGGFSSAAPNQGSFGGGFTPTYISPYITGLFGDATVTSLSELTSLNPGGSQDGWNTGSNGFTNANTFKGKIDGGEIDEVNVPVITPEPNSLFMLGSGLLALAGALSRRRRVSTPSATEAL